MHPYFRFLLLSGCFALAACSDKPTPATAAAGVPQFVGSADCANCHMQETSEWTGSHHDLAMQVADAGTVLGAFNQATFDYFDTSTEFLQLDGRFVVRTANANNEIQDFTVTHTFGVTPLQQYLVAFPGGRLQPLPFAWDSRSAQAGGQRWIHLYPDEFIGPGDELHWTGRLQNWNYMCAECHSTDLKVNYDSASDSFATKWTDMNVGCEACHGPASVHVAQARAGELSGSKGLQVDLDDHGRAAWIMNPQTGIAERSELAMRQSRQPEACGRCHARRGVIADPYEYGTVLADTHRVSLLDAPLYFDDGQIRDEVYVYGSFVQSRMYRAGVTCSDCHNPHSLTLRTGTDPNDVCSQCHLPTKFAVAEHSRHDAAATGCVDCHMPARIYMVVDPRRDHSFRIPRPDLSVAGDIPNACTTCHADRDAEWAATAAENWWGAPPPHFATALTAARHGAANPSLNAVLGDADVAGIVRATALTLYRAPLTQTDRAVIESGLQDADSLVRVAALRAGRLLPPDAQLQLASPLLKDAVRSVRIEAAGLLSPLNEYLSDSAGFVAAAAEYRAALQATASQPQAHVSLGDFATLMGDPDAAIQHYSDALEMDPQMSMSRLNYADALRRFGDEDAAEELLRDGIALNDMDAELRYSLGLLLVRTDRAVEGLSELRAATRLSPDNARFAYVVAIALNSLGHTDEALQVLRDAYTRFAGDFDIAWALATMLRDNGDTGEARNIAAQLARQHPEDGNVQALLASLDSA